MGSRARHRFQPDSFNPLGRSRDDSSHLQPAPVPSKDKGAMGPAKTHSLHCTLCRRQIEPRPENGFFPFCSTRCRQVDLGRWLGEEYRVANRHLEDNEDGNPSSDPDLDPASPGGCPLAELPKMK